MRFTKMHGIGNDYIYVDGAAEQVPDPAALARAISDRHFGVGGDGLILIVPSKTADVRIMFNADGSEAEMCGNGIRCLVKYAYEHGLAKSNPMRVQTAAGIKTIELKLEKAGKAAKVVAATVDMGEPILDPTAIPVNIPQARVVDVPVRTATRAFQMTCVSMGNPHAVIFVDDVSAVPLEQVGAELEHSPLFPERINVHFAQALGEDEVSVRTGQRGSGPTLACGNSALAVCVAGVLTRRTARKITVHLPGGDLEIHWCEQDNHVYMTGPAVEVFTGEWGQ